MTDQTAPRALPDLAAIRDALAGLPGPDDEAAAAAAAREPMLTKPEGALGRLEELAHWAAAWQGRHPAQVEHPRVAVFAGNHGVAARGVSAYPASVTAQMVRNFIAGGAAVNQLCRIADADLRVYELALDSPTNDFTQGPAMSPADCAGAIAYGMTAVEPGIDLLAVGEMGIANTTSAAALCAALWGGDAGAWVGPGTGVRGAALAAKIEAVEAGIAANGAALGEPLMVLAALGGRELAAIVGAVLAARLARVPVLLDGYAATAAASALYAVDARALDHCRVAHLSAEPAHRALCERIGQRPLLDLGMRLGEASGAALAIQLVRAAVECHRGMATFEEAAVSSKAG
ncbi:MAG: nicotinate-nucleotide--dimethylbenzimidazole phosphoribosyltransferase [Alphaproteobacteria bacterium]